MSIAAPRIIERPRVMRHLQHTLETCHVLLTGPAGYGKSMALRALKAERPLTQLVQLTPADLDPTVLKARLLPLLQPNQTILLDDVHVLEGGSEACEWLKQQLSQPEPRWLLAGRRLPFEAEFLAISGQAVHLTQEFLAFSLAETKLLLNAPEAEIASWHARLQGWSLGLSLLSRLPDEADPWPTTEAYLFTYLAETVFAQLPARLYKFMQLTAVPIHFNDPLAAHLWGDDAEAVELLAEIRQRDLYLQPAAQPGWWRYHDLIRDYLLQDHPVATTARQVIAWFEEQDDTKMAIEQALDSGLKTKAANLLATYNLSHFHGDASYLTYRRWIQGLDDAALAQNPMLLVRLGNVISRLEGYEAEAWLHMRRAIDLAQTQGDTDTALLGRINLALFHYRAGKLETARQQMMTILADPACEGKPRLFGLRIATLILGDMGHFQEASPYYEAAIELAVSMGTRNEPYMNRANRALFWAIPLGEFEFARREIEAVLAHFAEAPGWRSQYTVNWCGLLMAQGDWSALAEGVRELEVAVARAEDPILYTQLWLQHYRTALAIIQGDEGVVQAALAQYFALAVESPLNALCAAQLATWHLRRRGDWQEAMARADDALAEPYQFYYQRALLSLERDIAQAMLYLNGAVAEFRLHAETRQFVFWRAGRRAGPQLVRLRALLAIVCHHSRHPRWKRHVRAAVRELDRPGYARLLTWADPELGAQFWALAVAEGMFLPQATAALVEIGQPEPLFPHLEAADLATQVRVVEALAAIGDERAMPALNARLSNLAPTSPDEKVLQHALTKAIDHLETLPPPPLTIQLLGGFALYRDQEKIEASRWHRPVVMRLFQYFALNAGRPLSKDQILEDLWPGTPPQKAWKTFRTIYSLLRKVLEPFMPPKAPNRYVTVTGETYTFDPQRRTAIDSLKFEETVRAALRQRDAAEGLTLSASFLQALQTYAPILPDLPYEEWLLEPRERAQTLYVEGCLYAAQAYLAQGNYAEAVTWAKRARSEAPWLEAAYQTLMRAYARQGQRTLALRVFDEARLNLNQELGVEPAPLTHWLAERLRQGDTI